MDQLEINYPGPSPALTLQLTGAYPVEQVLFLKATIAVLSYLSLFGTLFNLFTTIFLGSSSQLMDKMIIGLSIMDLINNCLLPFSTIPITSDWACQLQSFITDFGFGGSLTFTCCFAHYLYITVNQQFAEVIDKIFNKYVILAIITALVVGTTSVVTGYRQINPDAKTCGHIPESGVFDLGVLFILVLPSIVSIGYCCFCYLTVVKSLREMGQKVFLVLLLYPLILIVTELPMTILRTVAMVNSSFQAAFGVSLVFAVLYQSRGLLNAFAYGLSRRIIEGYRKKCCKKRRAHNIDPIADEKAEKDRTSVVSELAFADDPERSIRSES